MLAGDRPLRLGSRGRDGKSGLGTDSPDTSGKLWEMLIYTLVMLAVGIAGWVLMKRIGPKMGKPLGFASHRKVALEQTVHLGARRSVHLVRVGKQRLLVGSCRESIRLLSDVSGAFDGEDDLAGGADE